MESNWKTHNNEKNKAFKFELGQRVNVVLNGDAVAHGPVISRCDYDRAESTYEVRHLLANGNQTQKFYTESNLQAV
jgi:hypothetical protein